MVQWNRTWARLRTWKGLAILLAVVCMFSVAVLQTQPDLFTGQTVPECTCDADCGAPSYCYKSILHSRSYPSCNNGTCTNTGAYGCSTSGDGCEIGSIHPEYGTECIAGDHGGTSFYTCASDDDCPEDSHCATDKVGKNFCTTVTFSCMESSSSSSSSSNVCGDGSVGDNEACDGGAHCKSDCSCEIGYEPDPNTSGACRSVCGDGFLADDEECDGANCTNCSCDQGFEPDPGSSDCRPLCGNGTVDPDEECDGGAACGGDCSCQLNYLPDPRGGGGCVQCTNDSHCSDLQTCNNNYRCVCAGPVTTCCEDMANADEGFTTGIGGNCNEDPICVWCTDGNGNPSTCSSVETSQCPDCSSTSTEDYKNGKCIIYGREDQETPFTGNIVCLQSVGDDDGSEKTCSVAPYGDFDGGSGGDSGDGGDFADIGGFGVGVTGGDSGGGSSTGNQSSTINVSSKQASSQTSQQASSQQSSADSSQDSQQSSEDATSSDTSSDTSQASSLTAGSFSSASDISSNPSSTLSSAEASSSSIAQHTQCQDNACILVLEEGEDQCETDEDCLEETSSSSLSSSEASSSLSSSSSSSSSQSSIFVFASSFGVPNFSFSSLANTSLSQASTFSFAQQTSSAISSALSFPITTSLSSATTSRTLIATQSEASTHSAATSDPFSPQLVDFCGNGRLDQNEQCDDGNRQNGDGCNALCVTEQNLVAAAALCGNGILEDTEECDDSNRRDNDGCSSNCQLEVGICGDGIIQTLLGEQCEAGTTLPDNVRCISCRFQSLSCGDGTIDPGEECDDGDQNSTEPDARCRPDCSLGRCGDAILDQNEQCDDGNRQNNDGCDRFCNLESSTSSQPTQVAGQQTEIPFTQQQPNVWPFNVAFPNQPNTQQIPYQLPLAQLQPLIQNQAPAGDTGPAAVAVVASGAAAGFGWMRKRKRK